MTYYETTLVVDSILEESATKEKIQHYVDLFVEHGAEILQVDHRGVRKLAYDIKGKDGTWRSQADYTFIYYNAPGSAVAPVEALMKLDEDVLRFMTVRPRYEPPFETPDEAPEPPEAPEAPAEETPTNATEDTSTEEKAEPAAAESPDEAVADSSDDSEEEEK